MLTFATLLKSNRIVSWCNGSTTVFGSVCRGSNPRETTQSKGGFSFEISFFYT